MPLDATTTSKFDARYCIYCQDQTTGALKTFDEVRAGCINAAVKLFNKSIGEATKIANEMLPNLPRWKKS